MLIQHIACDRCGKQWPKADAYAPRQVAVKLHRMRDVADTDKTVDLCETCYEVVQASVALMLVQS